MKEFDKRESRVLGIIGLRSRSKKDRKELARSARQEEIRVWSGLVGGVVRERERERGIWDFGER